MEKIRLQKYLAEAGIASRRKAEELIVNGKIKVNNKIIKELGTKIEPDKDKVEYEGKVVKLEEEKVYILLNKPIRICNSCKRTIWKRLCFRFSKGKGKNCTSSED